MAKRENAAEYVVRRRSGAASDARNVRTERFTAPVHRFAARKTHSCLLLMEDSSSECGDFSEEGKRGQGPEGHVRQAAWPSPKDVGKVGHAARHPTNATD